MHLSQDVEVKRGTMIPPLQSLVKYENPVQVSTAHDKKKGTKKVRPYLQQGLRSRRIVVQRSYC